MKLYRFKNKIKNQQIWPRFFVALSLSDAKNMAKEWEMEINLNNDNVPHLLICFDYDDVEEFETTSTKVGYFE